MSTETANHAPQTSGTARLPFVRDRERALTVKDVAAEFGVTPMRVYGWIKAGHIRPIRLPGGGPYRFRRTDLDEFETRCRGESSTAPTTVCVDGESQAGVVVSLDPFQRGRQSAPRPRNGEQLSHYWDTQLAKEATEARGAKDQPAASARSRTASSPRSTKRGQP